MNKNKISQLIGLFLSVFLVISFSLIFWNFNLSRDVLTVAERSWLLKHKDEILVAPDPQAPPLDMFDENGNHTGLSADYLKEIEKILDIKLKVVKYNTWNDILKAAKERKISIISLAMRTPDRERYLNFTVPIVNIPNVIVVNKNKSGFLTLNKMQNMKISVPEGYAVHEYLERKYKFLNLDPVKDTVTGLLKVSFQESDAMVIDLSQATYLINKETITNLRIAGDSGYYLNLGFGIRSDWPELTMILDKAILEIDKSKKESIYAKWIRLENNYFWKSQLFKEVVFYFLISACIIVLTVIIWNRILRISVRKKTAEIHEELILREKAEDDLRVHKEQLEEVVMQRTQQLIEKNNQLEHALAEVKRLSGIVPVCSNCRKIRDENDEWVLPDKYIADHSEAEMTHSLCPVCTKELYPNLYNNIIKK